MDDTYLYSVFDFECLLCYNHNVHLFTIIMCTYLQALLELLSDLKQQESDETETPCVHFIETGPSLLHEIPYILHRNYKVSALNMYIHAVCVCMYVYMYV